jgi:integrase/recombinase XerC
LRSGENSEVGKATKTVQRHPELLPVTLIIGNKNKSKGLNKHAYSTSPSNSQITQVINWHSLVNDWQDNLNLRVDAQEIKQDTGETYYRGVMKFIDWLGNKQPSADVIRQWKADLLKDANKSASVNAWLAGLRSFFGWLAEQGQIPFDPTQAIKGAKRKGANRSHVRELLTDREVVRLLAQPDRATREGARDFAMLSIMVYTAARGIELHRADIADLKTMDGALVLQVQGKGRDEKGEILVLSFEAENAVRDWLAIRGQDDGPLFTSCSNKTRGERLSRRALRGIVKGYMNAAGIHGNKTTHSLRHTAITNAIRHGVPVQKVKGSPVMRLWIHS